MLWSPLNEKQEFLKADFLWQNMRTSETVGFLCVQSRGFFTNLNGWILCVIEEKHSQQDCEGSNKSLLLCRNEYTDNHSWHQEQ